MTPPYRACVVNTNLSPLAYFKKKKEKTLWI